METNHGGTPPVTPPEGGDKRRGCLFWIGAIAGVGVLTLVIAGEVVRAPGKGRLAEEVAALGTALDPATFEPPSIPDDENAAILYERAFRAMRAAAPPDAARRAALLAALDRWDAIPFSRTLEGERAFDLASVQRFRADPASAFGFILPSWPDRIALRYVALLAVWPLDFLEDAIIAARRPAWEWTLDRAPVPWQARTGFGLGANLSRIVAKELEARAKLAVLRAAILRRTGDAGPLRADPFTGKPLLETVDASGARTVYSVGPDRVDDRGGGDDIATKVPR